MIGGNDRTRCLLRRERRLMRHTTPMIVGSHTLTALVL